ncbi:hypothetical protein A2757_02580 [Candidatus Giovannonibacteria bacterium RIFCSPHIGHO2_01_FULL_48_47]|nr:MAG: hypothetical protein A2757_02580 [Candidatus Giovannonibacteria bacterium RIFCSPHIGHO2_01_FULL_48_47]OGF67883.1 MAG: hypothetical protein A3D61_02190 [Candidatus Giovannonibacteria bacterium RIFCSPHIGHO2_02_FULL_48_15]OGF88148.1 MAG: hypothetical protein A3B26_00410 [Candidatus Giovannonibacteria bacterium RIFCSPLOWO2_01_FULL_48_47]OGF96007.1 MAG: hypothetical protein A2613_00340 [Candidatus Giovannonibacteria bacterium RIFOXYD1_FULL_48_21]HBT81279.1 hypothetical protein [Candidatus Gio
MVKLFSDAIRDLLSLILPARLFAHFFLKPVFVFLVHPRDMQDVYNKYPFFSVLSPYVLKLFLKWFWPVALSEITGVKLIENGNALPGHVFTISLTPEQMLEDKELARRKIKLAVRLAEKYGADVMGLGGYTSSVIGNAAELGTGRDIIVTSGNTLTAVSSIENIKDIFSRFGLKPASAKVAILGATGSVGKMVARLLSEWGIKNLILVSKTSERLKIFSDDLESKNTVLRIEYSIDISSLVKSDLIVAATNAPSSLIRSEHLKKGAIVYDISQPKNVSREVILSRPDCAFFEGGLVHSPENIVYNFNFRLPPHVIFSCLAETTVIAAAGFEKEDVVEGHPDYINLLRITAPALGFKPHYYKIDFPSEDGN